MNSTPGNVLTDARVLTARARLTRQGQISVPKAVRDQLGLEAGDELEFHVRADAAVVTRRRRQHVVEFAGLAASAAGRVPPTAEEIDALIREAAGHRALSRP